MSKIIPYGKQHITDDDIDAVSKALRSDFLTQGPIVKEFEDAFANYIGSKYAVAVSNGTAALHLCALALNVSQNDKVITTPLTFVASANCVKYCGGDVIFSDIDPDTYLIDIDAVEVLLKNSPKGTFKGIIPVDFAGRAVNLEKLRKLADEYNLWIIEDACHAPGGFFVDSLGNKQRCGNGAYADLSIFSLHPVKHIATGEGGVITTNDPVLYSKLLSLRTHGITRDKGLFSNSVEQAYGSVETGYPEWYMEMQELGFNYRLTDFQSALGLRQLSRADHGLSERKRIAKKYDLSFCNHPKIKSKGLELKTDFLDGHAYHLYVIEVENRLALYNYLRANNVYAQVHYYPVHLMPYYRNFGWKEGDMINVEEYYEKCLSLPMYPTLTNEEQEFVIKLILEFYE